MDDIIDAALPDGELMMHRSERKGVVSLAGRRNRGRRGHGRPAKAARCKDAYDTANHTWSQGSSRMVPLTVCSSY